MLTIVAAVVAGLLSFAAVAYVVWPLVSSRPAPVVVEDDRLTELVGRKDAVLAAIKDLEFDYYTGKLGDEDYARLDQRLRRQAIGLIQQIEKLAPESAVMDERLEAEIARLRKTRNGAGEVTPQPSRPEAVPAAEPPPADGVTAQTPQAAAPGDAETPRFCTECGQPLQPSYKFCAHCGAPVASASPTPAPHT